VRRKGGDRLREACGGRVYLRGEANKPQACKTALVAYENRQWRETGLPVQARHVGGGKAVGDPPTDRTPENGHWFMMVVGGCQTADPYKSIGAKSECARERQRWGGRPIPGEERRRIVASAVLARVYLLEKWDLGSKEGVKIKPSHYRRDYGRKS